MVFDVVAALIAAPLPHDQICITKSAFFLKNLQALFADQRLLEHCAIRGFERGESQLNARDPTRSQCCGKSRPQIYVSF